MKSASAKRNKAVRKNLLLPLKVAFLILLFYLLQTCVMPYFRIGGVIGNLNLVLIAILTVSLGKKYAFVSSAIIGIIMESMERNISSFYILIYPTISLIFAQLFSDMSEIKREMRRIQLKSEEQNKKINITRKQRFLRLFRRSSADDLNPHVRIFLNAMALQASYELIMIIIVALNGVTITWHHISNLILAALYTGILSLTMFPVRKFIGMYPKKEIKEVGDDYEQYEEDLSAEELQQIAVIPEMPEADALVGFEMRRDSGVEKIDLSKNNDDVKEEAYDDLKEADIKKDAGEIQNSDEPDNIKDENELKSKGNTMEAQKNDYDTQADDKDIKQNAQENADKKQCVAESSSDGAMLAEENKPPESTDDKKKGANNAD